MANLNSTFFGVKAAHNPTLPAPNNTTPTASCKAKAASQQDPNDATITSAPPAIASSKAKKELEENYFFNLKIFNELKKDQTNIKIFKNSSFDSSFNSVQSLNTNLSHLLTSSTKDCHKLLPLALTPKEQTQRNLSPSFLQKQIAPATANATCSCSPLGGANAKATPSEEGGENIKNPKFSAILRAIRSIRLNRDEWKLIRYINLMEKKIKISPPFACFSLDSTSSASSTSHPCYAGQKEQDASCKAKEEVNKYYYIKQNNKIFSNYNIISKNILLRNMKYNILKSTLSTILKQKIRKISEILEDKPIKNYVLYSYLNNCIFTPPHLNGVLISGARTKLSLNKYKGRKFGSFINYNKIIGYKFNSTFYPLMAALAPAIASASTATATASCKAKAASQQDLNGASAQPTIAYFKAKKDAKQPSFLRKQVAQAGEKSRGNIYIKDIYKLLFYLFKSMYCLISKPVLNFSNDKITIQLFYYLNIPKKKIFRSFSISYINSIKKKWLVLMEKKKTNFIFPASLASATASSATPASHAQNGAAPAILSISPAPNGQEKQVFEVSKLGKKRGLFYPKDSRVGNSKINIRWKLRKAISRFKNNNTINLLFKLRKFNLTAKAVYQNKFKLICAILSNKFNKPVELQLIRLHHPYHDSNILVNLLSLNIKNKRKKARVAVACEKIYNKKPVKFLNDPKFSAAHSEPLRAGKILPAFLSGLNIKIAGRLMGEPIIPRITTKNFGKGATAIGKVNYLDVARITKKNRKGAYTIKITSGQNFFLSCR